MTHDYSKWDRYEIGNIHFVKNSEKHPHRKVFIDFVTSSNEISSVVEVGPGEMIEYREISKLKKVDYSIIDVSKTFINNCKLNYPSVGIYNCPIEEIDKFELNNKCFDVIYAASVLEHSRNIRKMIENCINIAKRFHFVLFKWSYSGSLKSQYHKSKKYWSTSFNIEMLLDLIKDYGEIEYADVIIKSTGERITHDKYKIGKNGEVRTGYLMVHGNSLINKVERF